MELTDLFMYEIISKRKNFEHFSKKPFTGFCTKHSCTLFKGFFDQTNLKYFKITDTTTERIKNLPTEKITGGSLIELQKKQSSGLVFFNDGLHFIYTIRNNGIYILTSRERKLKKTTHDPNFYLGNVMSGFLYFDFISDFSQCYINNVLDLVLYNKDNLFGQDQYNFALLKKIQKEVANKNSEKTPIIDAQQVDFKKRWDDTRLCLQAFMFIHFAKVINTTRISFQVDNRTTTEKLMKKPIQDKISDIVVVDTLFDESIKVINPFGVKGHFRNQPYGKGRSENKTIYIDGFMKTGYTRIATKEKIGL